MHCRWCNEDEMKSMIVFIRILIGRELPPDQAEYCIQRMQPYSGMDAVQVEIPLNSLISQKSISTL